MFDFSKTFLLCIGIILITAGLITNCIQFIFYFGLKPFNKKLYRKIGYYLCYSYFSLYVCLADWWANFKLIVYVDPEVLKTRIGKEHSLVLLNHSYEIDWLFSWLLCEKQGVLGNCKAFAKKEVMYIPAIGWAWKFAEFIFLDRSFQKDMRIIERGVNEIFDYPDPCWLILTAEGTRFTKEKHEACNMFCRERGIPQLKHHLIPRTRGFHSSLKVLKAKCPSIIDMQVVIKQDAKFKPTFVNLFMGHQIIGHVHIRLFDTNIVPDGEHESAEWLQQIFCDKDALQESFYKHGDFFTENNFPRLDPIEMKPRLRTLLNGIWWAFVTLVPILYFIARLLFSGELYYFCIGSGILIVFNVLTKRIIETTETNKASSYGINSSQSSQSSK